MSTKHRQVADGNRQRDPADVPRHRKAAKAITLLAAVGWAAILEGFVPVIPDWALDQHTTEGRRMGRGLDHFRSEGAKLVPPPTSDRSV